MAARRYLVPIDLLGNEIRNAIAHLLAAAPGSPTEGQFYYDTVLKTYSFRTNTTWINLGRLDQISAPTADVSFNGQKATNLGNGVASSDGVNKGQLDAATLGLSWKAPVRAATTANGTLATAFAAGQIIDGVTLVLGDRILLKNQTAGAENGIRVVTAGTPTRAADADSAAELLQATVSVEEGTANADLAWQLTTNAPIVVDTTALVWARLPGVMVGGNGVVVTGNTIDVGAGATPGTGGPGGGLVVNADDVVIDKAVVARHAAGDIGDGAATAIDFAHNFGTLDVLVQVYVKGAAGALVECDIVHKDTNTVTLTFAVAPTSAQYRVICIG